MFGKNFKYILILTLLTWMTYSLSSVKAAFQGAQSFDPSDQAAAAIMPFRGIANMVRPEFSTSSMPGPIGISTSTILHDRHDVPVRPLLSPQQVITILVKLGYVDHSKADQARIDLEKYIFSQNATSTRPVGAGDHPFPYATSTLPHTPFPYPHASTTRPMMPQLPRNDEGRQ